MDEIIIAVIGSITTILTAIITGLFAKNEIEKSEKLIPKEEAKIINNLQGLRKERKSAVWKFATIVAFFIGVLFTFAGTSYKEKWDSEKKIETVNSNYNNLLKKGFDNTSGNPYIFPAISMNILLEKVNDSMAQSHLEADITIVYNSVYFKEVDKVNRAFNDNWIANRNGEVIKLNGSDKEVISAGSTYSSKQWNTYFETSAGNNRMTVSHIKVIYPLELKSYDSDFFGTLTSNEEVFEYPNQENDAIGELIIMVSSSTLPLKINKDKDAAIGSLLDLMPRKWIDANSFNTTYKGLPYNTITARFPEFQGKEIAKLKVSW